MATILSCVMAHIPPIGPSSAATSATAASATASREHGFVCRRDGARQDCVVWYQRQRIAGRHASFEPIILPDPQDAAHRLEQFRGEHWSIGIEVLFGWVKRFMQWSAARSREETVK